MLEIQDLKIAYPGDLTMRQWAIDGVSLTLSAGETMGLVGESGCGKSTIGKAILRLLPDRTQIEGDIRFEGRSLLSLSPKELQKFRGEAVGLVFQDPMTRLDPLMSIGDHCTETLRAHHRQLTRRQAKDRACEMLEKVKIPPNRWAQYPHEFSGGMRQRVAIALALLLKPKFIIADEPTTSLDVTVAAEILRELKRLCVEEKMGLLLISHDLAMVGEYCDRLAVMTEGKIVEAGFVESIFQHPEHEYTRSLLASALHLQVREEKQETAIGPTREPLLKVRDLQQYYTLEGNLIDNWFKKEQKVIKAVDTVNFELYRGEIFGLVGESGCGKSTLSRTILQLIPATSGSVEFLGEELTHLSREKMRPKRRSMQMIFQDPLACLNPLMTVGESVADPLLIHRLASPDKVQAAVEAMLERVGLQPARDFYSRYPLELSGGQQQRVAIARALITRPQLIICDEPVSMLDASVQTRVLELMLELRSLFDLTYLFITHDLWLARFLCDRVAVMTGGKIVEMGNTEQIFSDPHHPYTRKLLAAAPRIHPERN
jgi:peptide/nickel transport system ATP-binding protein